MPPRRPELSLPHINRLTPLMARRRRGIRLLLAAGLALAALALGSCGEEHKTDIVEGEPVELGPLEYNVLFSRFLNPNDEEDRSYLTGQPPPPPNQLYLGVFAQVENHDEENSQPLPDTFTVVDTDEREFEAIPSESLYALELGGEVPPDEELPIADSVAAVGPIEGSLILFQLPDASTEAQPLKLIIEGEDGPAEVELDI
jgi:hypothetical protein